MQSIKTYGRTRGRPLSNRQTSLVNTRLDGFLVPKNIAETEQDHYFNPLDLMPKAKEVWFEIGFGGGEHLVNQAKANPDVLIIGAEPYFDGVAKVLTALTENNIQNVRLINDDARKYLQKFTSGSLARLFIMFPDPWQKARHRKRRLINQEFCAEIVRLLKPSGKLRFATDWANYAETALMTLTANPDLVWQAQYSKDWLIDPKDHFPTRYQLKKLGDCTPHFFDFIRA